MYITHNNQTYANVRVYSTSGSVRFTGESLTGVTALTGPVGVFADNGFQMQTYTPGDFLRQEITDGSWLLTNTPVPTPQPVTVQPVTYDLTVSTANAVRLLMAGKQPEMADEVIMCSALYPEWTEGVHTKDEIYTVGADPWVCLAGYDNAVYPDIVPGNAAWHTFNRPLHGTTAATARPFVQPTGAHDMYHAGEYAIYNAKMYRCTADTAYSPADYAASWEAER